MPPLKKYVFEHLEDENIKIEIMSYSFEGAYYVLVETTQHPADFKCISI